MNNDAMLPVVGQTTVEFLVTQDPDLVDGDGQDVEISTSSLSLKGSYAHSSYTL